MTEVQEVVGLSNWHRISREDFEDIVCCLLAHLYNREGHFVERLDGAGGDGGRDLTVSRPDNSSTIFQVKHFADRLTKTRKNQIMRSLAAAAQHAPDEWVLVLSRDLTPAENDWFGSLQGRVPFPITWLGRNWLNVELGQRPWIVSGFLPNAHQQLLRLLAEFREEERAVVQGVEDATVRINRIVEQLGGLSAHYKPVITIDDQWVRVDHRPRYPGADRESPITLTIEATLSMSTDSDRARLKHIEEQLGWGESATFEPHEVHAFENGPFSLPRHPPGRWTVGKLMNHEPLPPGRLLIVDDSEEVVRSLSAVVTRLVQVPRGWVVEAEGANGLVAVVQRFDPTDGQVHLSIESRHTTKVDAATLLPALTFLSFCRSGYSFVLEVDGQAAGAPTPFVDGRLLVAEDQLDIVAKVRQIADLSGQSLEVPPQVDANAVLAIERVHALLSGEGIPSRRTRTRHRIHEPNRAELQRMLECQGGFEICLDYSQPLNIRVLGTMIKLGRSYAHAPVAHFTDPEEVVRCLERADPFFDLDLTFPDDQGPIWRLGVPPEPSAKLVVRKAAP